MVKYYLPLLNTVFVACSLYYLLGPGEKPPTSAGRIVDYCFMFVGLLLLISSVLLRKRFPTSSLIAWLTLFLTFVLAALFPRLSV